MRVLVAGGSGTIGVPLVRALVSNGHQVTALSRSKERHAELRAIGASVLATDALDRDALRAAVEQARPTHIIHQLTALPKGGPRRSSDIEATSRLRIEGTRNLLEAAIRARIERIIVGSFAILAHAADEGAPTSAAADAVQSMERQVMEASTGGTIEGIVLRYGMFYGSQVPSTQALVELVRRRRMPVIRGDAGRLPFVHLEDAVSATVCALDHGAPGSTVDVVDDRAVSFSEFVGTVAERTGSPTPWSVPPWVARLLAPDMAGMLGVRLSLSNEPARMELGWRPRYSTIDEGLTGMLRNAA